MNLESPGMWLDWQPWKVKSSVHQAGSAVPACPSLCSASMSEERGCHTSSAMENEKIVNFNGRNHLVSEFWKVEIWRLSPSLSILALTYSAYFEP